MTRLDKIEDQDPEDYQQYQDLYDRESYQLSDSFENDEGDDIENENDFESNQSSDIFYNDQSKDFDNYQNDENSENNQNVEDDDNDQSDEAYEYNSDQDMNEIQQMYDQYDSEESSIDQQQQQNYEIIFDHKGLLWIDYNEKYDLIAYPHQNYLWICTNEMQYSYRRWIDEYQSKLNFLIKFSYDCEYLTIAQGNVINIFQININQVTLSLFKKVNMNNQILSIFQINKSLICDFGDKIILVDDVDQNQLSLGLEILPKQLKHYQTQQYNGQQILLIRGDFFVLINGLK